MCAGRARMGSLVGTGIFHLTLESLEDSLDRNRSNQMSGEVMQTVRQVTVFVDVGLDRWSRGFADAFGRLVARYGKLFATRGRDNAAVAQRYLQGLTQASSCTFAAMADVVEDGCAQQFQHFISNSPWQHELVVAQIGLGSVSSKTPKVSAAWPIIRRWAGKLGTITSPW